MTVFDIKFKDLIEFIKTGHFFSLIGIVIGFILIGIAGHWVVIFALVCWIPLAFIIGVQYAGWYMKKNDKQEDKDNE